MRVLFVVEHFYPYIGGVEELFYALGKSLVAEGHQVSVITTRHDRSLPQQDEIAGMSVFRINAGNRFLFTLLATPVVWRHARRHHLIHTTSYNAAWPAWLGGKLARKPVVITFHEVWGQLWRRLPWLSSWEKYLYRRYEAFLLRLPFRRFIAVSTATANQLELAGVSAAQISIIYNGLSYDALAGYQSAARDQHTFCYYGRLGASKGLDLLLPAWAAFAKQQPDARLTLIIPTYPKRTYNRLLEQIETLGIASSLQIKHMLPRKELLSTVAKAGCVVIPSYAEGFCFAAAEAVALGVPIISSGRGALAEVVGGQVVQMDGQSVEGLLNALHAAWARDFTVCPTQQFPLAATIAGYTDMYKTVLD